MISGGRVAGFEKAAISVVYVLMIQMSVMDKRDATGAETYAAVLVAVDDLVSLKIVGAR